MWAGPGRSFSRSSGSHWRILMMRGAPKLLQNVFRREDFFRIIPIYYLWILGYILLASLGGPFVSRTLSFRCHAAARASDLLPFFVSSKPGFIHVTGLTAHGFRTHGLSQWKSSLPGCPAGLSGSSQRNYRFFLRSGNRGGAAASIGSTSVLSRGSVACQRSQCPLALTRSRSGCGCYPLAQCNLSSWPHNSNGRFVSSFGLVFGGAVASGGGRLSLWRLEWSPLGYSCMALFYGVMLLLVLARPTSLLRRAARIGWLRELGRVSYCVYLIHLVSTCSCMRFCSRTYLDLDGRAVVVSLLRAFSRTASQNFHGLSLSEPLLRRGTPSATSSLA